MSKIALNSNASGTGVFTIASPNSDTDRTLTLPDSSGDFVLSASGVISDFTSTGIDDNATSTAITIDASENVGIGTTSPDESLVVQGGVKIRGTNKLSFTNTSDQTYIQAASTNVLAFGTNSSERMRIDSSGKLLVGSTTSVNGSTSTLQVLASSTSSGGLTVAQPNSASTATLRAQSVSTASTSWYQFLGQSGNGSTITTNNIFIYGNGNIVNSNNSYGAISDASLKSNIVDASSQIDDIMAVQVRSYTLNETGDTHIGVVAQELEASGMGGLVEEDGEGVKSVKYSILYMKAIKALQEAVAKIEDLESRLSALETN